MLTVLLLPAGVASVPSLLQRLPLTVLLEIVVVAVVVSETPTSSVALVRVRSPSNSAVLVIVSVVPDTVRSEVAASVSALACAAASIVRPVKPPPMTAESRLVGVPISQLAPSFQSMPSPRPVQLMIWLTLNSRSRLLAL